MKNLIKYAANIDIILYINFFINSVISKCIPFYVNIYININKYKKGDVCMFDGISNGLDDLFNNFEDSLSGFDPIQDNFEDSSSGFDPIQDSFDFPDDDGPLYDPQENQLYDNFDGDWTNW